MKYLRRNQTLGLKPKPKRSVKTMESSSQINMSQYEGRPSPRFSLFCLGTAHYGNTIIEDGGTSGLTRPLVASVPLSRRGQSQPVVVQHRSEFCCCPWLFWLVCDRRALLRVCCGPSAFLWRSCGRRALLSSFCGLIVLIWPSCCRVGLFCSLSSSSEIEISDAGEGGVPRRLDVPV